MLRDVVRLLLLLVRSPRVSILIFFWVHALPGNPASALLGERATPELVKQYKERYGLDRPLPLQYVDYLKVTVVDRDLGTGHHVASHRHLGDRTALPGDDRARRRSDVLRHRHRLPLGFFAASVYGGVFDNLSLTAR